MSAKRGKFPTVPAGRKARRPTIVVKACKFPRPHHRPSPCWLSGIFLLLPVGFPTLLGGAFKNTTRTFLLHMYEPVCRSRYVSSRSETVTKIRFLSCIKIRELLRCRL